MRALPRRAAAAALTGFFLAVWALTAVQRFAGSDLWWVEFARFLPYPLLLVPALLAVAIAWPLGAVWRVAAAATGVLVATAGMGLSWRSDEAPSAGATGLRLMTWNAKTVQASERPGGLAAIEQEVVAKRPDVVVMQDANALRHRLEAMPGQPMFGLANVWGAGQYLVASRYPLEGCEGREAGGLWIARCRVVAPVPFELVTVHLESPRAGLLAARREGIEGVDTWEANLALRMAQSRALARVVFASPRPIVLAGDLNAAESSDVVQRLIAGGLRDAFSAGGRGYGYTYGHTLRPKFSFLRIDHVLVSPEVAVSDCFVGTETASDHRPVIADLRFEPGLAAR